MQVDSFFRGKDFVVKYEGCFKNGNSDCFVLEHVEHDRSEVIAG
jgi:cell division control protein 7